MIHHSTRRQQALAGTGRQYRWLISSENEVIIRHVAGWLARCVCGQVLVYVSVLVWISIFCTDMSGFMSVTCWIASFNICNLRTVFHVHQSQINDITQSRLRN